MTDVKVGGQGRRVRRPKTPPGRPDDRGAAGGFWQVIDRHLTRATDSDRMLRRYLRLCGAATLLMLAGPGLFVTGLIVAVRYAGQRPWVAATLGLTTASALVAGWLRRIWSGPPGSAGRRRRRAG